MTVAVWTVIRCPPYLSLTPRYKSGFDNNWSFRHFIARFAFAHLFYPYLTIFYSLFFYRFTHLCYLGCIIEVVWWVFLKTLTGGPTSIFIIAYTAHIEWMAPPSNDGVHPSHHPAYGSRTGRFIIHLFNRSLHQLKLFHTLSNRLHAF